MDQNNKKAQGPLFGFLKWSVLEEPLKCDFHANPELGLVT
jgi:hypothetical protein